MTETLLLCPPCLARCLTEAVDWVSDGVSRDPLSHGGAYRWRPTANARQCLLEPEHKYGVSECLRRVALRRVPQWEKAW